MAVQTTAAESAALAQAYRFYELVDAGDVPGLARLFTLDAHYHRPGYEPIIGQQGITTFYSKDRVIRKGQHTVEAAVVKGNEVAVRGVFHGSRHDGSAVELRYADFFTTASDGRFHRRETFFFVPRD